MKLVSQEISEAWGYGTIQGHTITRKYSCPCGNGFVITENDTHVGFKQFHTWIDCSACNQVYQIENPTSRSWSIIPKNSEVEPDWMK